MSLLLLSRSPVSVHGSGVLKVWDSTTSTWRKIGCGGVPGATISQRATPPWSWDTLPVRAQVVTYAFAHAATPAPSGPYLYWFEFRQSLTTGEIHSLNLVSGDGGSYPRITSRTVDVGAGYVLIGVGFDANAMDPAVLDASDDPVYELFWSDPLPTIGRLRMQLPDGSWVREACDADTGAGPNLLTTNQAGFESGTTTGWAVLSGYDAVLTAVTTPTPPVGSYAMAIEHTSTTGALPFTTPTGTAGMAVSPSAEYSITAQFRTSSGGTLNCQTFWYDSTGTLISANVLGEIPWTANDTWIAQAWSDTAPSTAAFLSVEFTVEHIDVNAKRAWIDDIDVHVASAKHPLKIEDPANPGTWITVACMVPV